MDFLEIWNVKFGELLSDLSAIFGDDGDLSLLRVGFAVAVAASKEGAWRVFHDQVVVPYGARVLARDETFFLESLGGDDLPTGGMDIVARVRVAWKGLSPANRLVIWDYFVLLVRLSQRVTI